MKKRKNQGFAQVALEMFIEKRVCFHDRKHGHTPKFFGTKIQSNPAISKSQGNGKKFEIAGFRNNRGSVKFVNMNHFLIKYSTV